MTNLRVRGFPRSSSTKSAAFCTVKGSYASHTAALEAHFRACAPLDAGRSGFAGVVSGARPVVERAELPATEELPTVDEPEEGRPRALRMAPS